MGGVGIASDWFLLDALGNQVGYATYFAESHLWPVTDLAHNPNGVMECYNYGTHDDPMWTLSIVTNLFEGFPGQYKPLPLDAVGDAINFQRITSTTGPVVGSILMV
jgi:hypothetical protein